jgi:hypothetical protein
MVKFTATSGKGRKVTGSKPVFRERWFLPEEVQIVVNGFRLGTWGAAVLRPYKIVPWCARGLNLAGASRELWRFAPGLSKLKVVRRLTRKEERADERVD